MTVSLHPLCFMSKLDKKKSLNQHHLHSDHRPLSVRTINSVARLSRHHRHSCPRTAYPHTTIDVNGQSHRKTRVEILPGAFHLAPAAPFSPKRTKHQNPTHSIHLIRYLINYLPIHHDDHQSVRRFLQKNTHTHAHTLGVSSRIKQK